MHVYPLFTRVQSFNGFPTVAFIPLSYVLKTFLLYRCSSDRSPGPTGVHRNTWLISKQLNGFKS